MTATERLRAMLDERGVEYIENDFGITWSYYNDPHTATESMDGTLIVTGLTPEQAIDATLGRGECRKLPPSGDAVCIVRKYGYEMEFGYWRCSECGCECFEGARYCMGCGRKVRA